MARRNKYQNGGNVHPRRGKQGDPGRKTDIRKLRAYQFYTPEEKIEQYKYWDKDQPGGRQYNTNELPLDKNHPDYGTSNWKYLTDPDRRAREEARGIKYVFDNKGRLVRLNRRGNPMGGTRAQRNERNITPKGPQQETIRLEKKEVTKLPTKETPGLTIPNKTITQPEIKQDETPPPTDDKKGGQSFDEAFKEARERGDREFEWAGDKTGGETRKFHTRRADETEEQWNEKFPKGGTEKTQTASEKTQEGNKTVESKDKEPEADMEEVKLTPDMQKDKDTKVAKKETKSPMDTSDDELEKTFVKAMDEETKKPAPSPAPKQKPEPEPEPKEAVADKEPDVKEEKEAPEPKEAKKGAMVRVNKKGRKRRRYDDGGTTEKKETLVKLHKDEDKKTIGDTNLTLSGDFGIDAAKKNASKKTDNGNGEDKDDTSNDTTKKEDVDATSKPEKEEGRGHYHDGSDTPQVIRDKDIDRNRGWDDGDDDVDGDGELTDTKRTKLTRDERFDRRQQRKEDRNERRLERRRQRENRKKYRKESRQYRRTQRRKQRQEKRADRGMKYTGGRRISPRRWWKNLKDKLGGTVWEGRGRLKDYDEFKTSRTVKPVREYKRGGMMDSAAERPRYDNGGTPPKKESRLRSRWNRFWEKRDEKPISEHQFYTSGPESIYSYDQKLKGAMTDRGLDAEIKMNTKELNKLKNKENLSSAEKKRMDQLQRRLNMQNKITEQKKYPKENRMTSREIYLKEKEAQAKASQEAWDKKKEGWKEEDKKEAEKRAEGSEKHKQRTTMPMMSSMKKKGGMVRKYMRGGIRAINKEGRKHGASKEDMDYAKNLYRGASGKQKKEAMQMYRQYKKTGEIPEGAEDLYHEAGGDRFMKDGGRVRKYMRGGQAIIHKEGKKHGASSEEMSYMKNLYKNASPKQKKEAMKMYREYQRTGEIPEGAKELYNEAGGDRMMQEGGKVKKGKKMTKKKLPRDDKGNVVYGPAGDADPDQLTFGEAFADARRAGTSRFKWRGKWYTTKTK